MGNEGVKVFPDQVDLDIPVWSEDERPARLAACRFAGDSDGLLLFLVHQEARHAVQSGSIAFEQLVVLANARYHEVEASRRERGEMDKATCKQTQIECFIDSSAPHDHCLLRLADSDLSWTTTRPFFSLLFVS